MAILEVYSNYNNVFTAENIIKLLNYIGINNYAIKLEKSKQLLFKPIYSFESVELEMLKTYIKINWANSFVQPFKSSTRVPIFWIEN